MNEAPDLRSLPVPDRAIVGRALEKDPTKRFPSCMAFVLALYNARTPTFANINLDSETPNAPHRGRIYLDSHANLELEIGAPGTAVPEDSLVSVGLSGVVHEDNQAVSRLGVTIAQPSTGPLRPTLIIGVGGFGRRALNEVRCRFIDRFGDLDRLPMVRFLYVDTDAEAVKGSQRGGEEIAFTAQQVYHMPLQPVSHYRRRQIDQLADWLPQSKLYAIPRSLNTQGVRALARLAFTDNYLRLMARLKRELQHACHPDAIYQTVNQTGLAVRDATPRVYVLGSGAGGASGYLSDLGFAIRRLLHQSDQADASVVSFLFCGAAHDPATPRDEQANLYATMTELNHYADPNIPFSAQYGTDGPRLTDDAPAFDQVYLLSQPHRSPEGRRDAIAHVGSYLFHELTTPLGLRLDQTRERRNSRSMFRNLGTFGVWFPRGLLLRVAAREMCKLMLDEWQSGAGEKLTGPEQSVLDAALARVLGDPELRPEALASRIDVLAANTIELPPLEALTRILVPIEEQANQPLAQDDPGSWSRQMLNRVYDWLGSGLSLPGVNAVQQRRSPLTRALESAAAQLAQEWADRIGEVLKGLMEHSGRRLAVAEAAVDRLSHFCDDAIQTHTARLQQRSGRSGQQQEQLDQAVQNCHTGAGAWSLFGGRSRRQLRVFVDYLAAFARQCVVEDTAAAVLQFFAALRGKLADRLRDLSYARQRLRSLQESLSANAAATQDIDNVADTITFSRTPGAGSPHGTTRTPVAPAETASPLWATEAYWHSIRESLTARVVLPENAKDLKTAARRFLRTLNAEHCAQLDQTAGDHVLAPAGGLLKLCLESGDIARYLAAPLLMQTLRVLSQHLPITDVAQVEATGDDTLTERILGYHAQAMPVLIRTDGGSIAANHRAGVGSGVRQAVVAGAGVEDVGATNFRPDLAAQPTPTKSHQPAPVSYLLIPASEAGKSFGEHARRAIPDLHLVNVAGQADLMFCREQVGLRIEDLEEFLAPCRNAYHALSLSQQSSPHSRFDVTDWTPLDP
jgi:hypothetical protein